MSYDNILLAAFGGPTPACCKGTDPCPGEAHCFVEGILGKSPERAGRVREVAEHYRRIGGFSPFNALTFLQAAALGEALRERGIRAPVRAGMRHWTPTLASTLDEIARAGSRRTLAVILAPHQSAVSWDWYQQVIAEGCKALGASAPSVDYLDIWPAHPGFVEAVADGVRDATRGWAPDRLTRAELVFTAHAIPMAVASRAPYCHQFQQTAAAAAKAIGHPAHRTAYQSQATDATIPWTAPDVNDVIREAAARGVRDIVVSPAGFLVDHVEVLYDLDIAARRTAQDCAVAFTRAATVGSHPAFIGMLADMIARRWTAEAAA